MVVGRAPLITRQEAAALISSLVNAVLTVAKFLLFYHFVRSVSLQAEAWHSLSDIGSSFVVFLALLMGRRQAARLAREPDQPVAPEQRSSGLFSEPEEPAPEPSATEEPAPAKTRARPEDIVAVGIACLFIVVAVGIIFEIFQPQEIKTDYALVVAAGMLAMAYSSYLLYRFEYQVGLESDSPALIADGYHSKIDMYGSLLVAIALVTRWLGVELADQIIAAMICLGILCHAIEVLAMAARHYLGRPLERDQAHGHGGALGDVYALTGKWGERLSSRLTAFGATVLGIRKSTPELGRRVGHRLVVIVVLGTVMLYILSGLFTCKPGERAFIERFGRLRSSTPLGPGLHYRWPWPIERTVKVEVDFVRTLPLGDTGIALDRPILWTNRHFVTEYRFLTGDDKFLTLFLTVHYRVGDLEKFLYECTDPRLYLHMVCWTRIRELVGARRFFDCLSSRTDRLEEQVEAELVKAGKDVGIEVLGVSIRDMHPPVDVAPAFEAVISAGNLMHATINRANAYATRQIPRARAQAAERLAEAESFRARQIGDAQSATGEFAAQQEKYAVAKEITRVRLYLEMLEKTIARTPKWVLLGGGKDIPFELWFPKGSGFWRWSSGMPRQGGPSQ